MLWWLVAMVAWTVVAAATGMLLGAVARTANRREGAGGVPSHVPPQWSVTASR
jgi:hypothetical protein